MSRLRKRLLGVLFSLGLIGAFGASGYAYLGQYQYDATDPTVVSDGTDACAVGAYTPSGYNISVTWGTLELRWSPDCQTIWARFTCSAPPFPYTQCGTYWLRVKRDIPDGAMLPDQHVTDGTPRNASVYTLEVNDAGSFRSHVCWWTDLTPSNVYCTNDF